MPHRPIPTKIYHITHIENIPSIMADGGLFADAEMCNRGGPKVSVGMTDIKRQRMDRDVTCHSPDKVGEYVPFFFCPRSIMLYIFHKANRPGLTYHGGQGPIVHLQLEAEKVIAWADDDGTRWAFTTANAATAYTPFFCTEDELDNVNWAAVEADDFRPTPIKEGKQAEFLVKRFVPWSLVDRVGVHSEGVRRKVLAALAAAEHQPSVEVCTGWYF